VALQLADRATPADSEEIIQLARLVVPTKASSNRAMMHRALARRATYLREVPENARLLDLAAKWSLAEVSDCLERES
jgi:hypothetical protein